MRSRRGAGPARSLTTGRAFCSLIRRFDRGKGNSRQGDASFAARGRSYRGNTGCRSGVLAAIPLTPPLQRLPRRLEALFQPGGLFRRRGRTGGQPVGDNGAGLLLRRAGMAGRQAVR